MATTLISNGAFSGAIGAALSGRWVTSTSLTGYATQVAAADAFRDQFLTANAALTVPMADADNAQIGEMIASIVGGILSGRMPTSATAGDYSAIASAAVAACKEAIAQLV